MYSNTSELKKNILVCSDCLLKLIKDLNFIGTKKM